MQGFAEIVESMGREELERPWASYLQGMGPLSALSASGFEADANETDEDRKIRKGMARLASSPLLVLRLLFHASWSVLHFVAATAAGPREEPPAACAAAG